MSSKKNQQTAVKLAGLRSFENLRIVEGTADGRDWASSSRQKKERMI